MPLCKQVWPVSASCGGRRRLSSEPGSRRPFQIRCFSGLHKLLGMNFKTRRGQQQELTGVGIRPSLFAGTARSWRGSMSAVGKCSESRMIFGGGHLQLRCCGSDSCSPSFNAGESCQTGLFFGWFCTGNSWHDS